jgi:hypothetical protein
MRFFYLFIIAFSMQLSTAQTVSEIDVLEDKATDFQRRNNDSLLFYGKEILQKSSFIKYKKGIAAAYKLLALGNYFHSNNKEAVAYSLKAINLYNKLPGNYESIADCYRIIGNISLYNQEFDKAYYNIMKAKVLYDKEVHLKKKGKKHQVLNDLAYLYIIIEDFDKALVVLNDLQSHSNNDKNVLAYTYTLFSIISDSQNEHKESIVYFEKAKSLYEKMGDNIGVLTSELGVSAEYYYLKDYPKAIHNLNKTLVLCQKWNFSDGVQKAYLILAKCYIDKNELEKAQFYLDKVLKIRISDKLSLEDITSTRVNLLMKKRKFDEAATLVNDFLKENPSLINPSKIGFYTQLKEIYEKKGDYKKGLFYQKEIALMEAKEKSKNQLNKVAMLRAEFNFKNIENELELKSKELELVKEKEKNTYYAIGFLIVLGILSIAFFIAIYSRQKKIGLMNKKILQGENQFLESKRKQTALEMEFKNKEITDFAIHISEKNELLEGIKNKIKDLRLKDSDAQSKLTELVFFINNNITQNMEKVGLYSNVQETTDSFFQKLETLFPDLTEKETRVASLARLQLSSKQISQQLNISPASVDNYRSVLRRKMNVSKEKSLQDFLKNLS